MEMYKYITK